ncbi:MAG: hypothetical protein KDC61_08875 [Saprospiraceae bacterium]|nr:hypothetical protein [Saprospiraceae bacterium]MCB0543332.1 hypothetical protein [Saprospiraceae bacterium]MCB0574665.1 hypothetical protein [Saprospiraceae bacterium]MCB9306197.1 hypothetical protein [Lewinellaceae bacterium]MCB9354865.1 hypothetical protein [Lewinellaceae bacterium]
MRAKLNIDRHFLFFHGNKLAVFAERILRDTQQNPYIDKPEKHWERLRKSCADLRVILEDPDLKRKERTDAIREKEAPVLVALGQMADYIETAAPCKSDVFTTGFRPQTEHRRPTKTRRSQRMSVKLALLESARQSR